MIHARVGARLRPPLTALETDVMQAVWQQGTASVESVHKLVSPKHGLQESSIRTILRRLEQKGYIRHKLQGRAYIYEGAARPASLAAVAVRQIVDSFCSGSMEELVSGMVEAKVLSKAELTKLEQFVRRHKEGDK